jgi:hypothetical protein
VNPKEDPDMTHSLIGADGCTHCKIIAVVVASAASVILLGSAALRAPADAPTARPQATGAIYLAGKPAMTAAAGTPIIR